MFSLSANCEAEQGAEQFSQYFQSLSMSLQCGRRISCSFDILQDKNDCWWSRVLLHESDQHWLDTLTETENIRERIYLENIFYEYLRSAPVFRYALLGEGVDQLILRCETFGIFESLKAGDTPWIAYLQGIVMAEAIHQNLNHPSPAFQLFSPGYVWIPPGSHLLPANGQQHTCLPREKKADEAGEVMYQKGTTLLGRSQYEASLTAYTFAQKLRPYAAAPLQGKAVSLYHLQRYEEASRACEQALRIDPALVEAHHLKAGILYAQGQFEAALASCDRVRSLDPNFSLVAEIQKSIVHDFMLKHSQTLGDRLDQARALRVAGQYDAAVKAFDEVLSVEPTLSMLQHSPRRMLNETETLFVSFFSGIYLDKGTTLGHMDEHEQALRSFEQALNINPTFDDVYQNRDLALCKLGRSQEILGCYDRLLSAYPGYAYGHYRKGVVLDQLKQYGSALLVLYEAIRLDPNLATAYHSLGIVLDHLGQPQKALDYLNKALALNPTCPYTLSSQRIVLRRIKHAEASVYWVSNG